MRGAIAIVLSILYIVGAFQAASSFCPSNKDLFPLILFMAVVLGALFSIALVSCAFLLIPVPWALRGSGYGPPPRKVRLSLRAMLGLPSSALLVFGIPMTVGWWAANAASSARGRNLVLTAIGLGCLALQLRFVRRLSRERRLVTYGATTLGHIDERRMRARGNAGMVASVRFHFLVSGEVFSSVGLDQGYFAAERSILPVFYEAGNPAENLVACGSYFEVVDQPVWGSSGTPAAR